MLLGGVIYCMVSLCFLPKESLIVGKIAVLYFFICIFYFVKFIYSVATSIQSYTIIEENFTIAKDVVQKEIDFRNGLKEDKCRKIYPHKKQNRWIFGKN